MNDGKITKRLSLQELSDKFGKKNFYLKMQTDPLFRKAFDCYLYGLDPESIIEQLIGIINSQQKQIEHLVEHTPSLFRKIKNSRL